MGKQEPDAGARAGRIGGAHLIALPCSRSRPCGPANAGTGGGCGKGVRP